MSTIKAGDSIARKDEAYNYLKNAILTYQLSPDEAISEMAISKELNISRTPVREAMRELEIEGLIVSYPSRGSFVASLTPYDVEEIYELRCLLEVWALKRSITRITEEELDEVEKMLKETVENLDWAGLHKADRRLHGLIVEKSGSKRLVTFVNTLNSQIERVRRISAKEQGRSIRSYKEHMQIIDCIRQRDLERCESILEEHLHSVANSAIEVVKSGIC